ncbi:MAG: sodium-dependent transporter [Massilibacteroides sp.]|nr:sodium-dependent transporter [Massilibacteroides sp.]MDD3062519.1 sodium-dependent transporter [Massilibacteroides sp.]MDD4115536.1 sodium-dependent transporter [Massilibacteroides sp.]MDD4660335.1 sodium-dependent transporter [Massilibacteroides sp.]
MENIGRATFGSKFGALMATLGTAVGLGNIWRFPYMCGANGGGAFLFVFLLCALLLGLPVMITEFFIGRHSKKNATGAFDVLAPGTHWNVIGFNGVLAAFLILGFYTVVSGWTMGYMFQSLSGSLNGKTADDFTSDFSLFISSAPRLMFWTVIVVIMTHYIIYSGVKKGIERSAKFMMPLLFIVLFALTIRSITLPGAKAGLQFLFNPDFSKITSATILSAMGQSFFSLSIGMGCLITYSSYFGKTTNIQTTAFQVTLLDTFVAVLASVMIFPAVFSFGIQPTAGAELVFITLPNVFEQLPLGNLWAFVFYLLLAVAAITSIISLHEVVTLYIHEEHHVTRKKAAIYVSAGILVLASISSLSLGIWKEYTLFGLTFFDFLDYITAKIMLPFGGMMICIFVGRRIEKKILKEELTNKGTTSFYFFNIYAFFIKHIAPVAIGLIFLYETGLIHWIMNLLN